MDAALLSQYQELVRALQDHPQDTVVEGFERATLLRILKNLAVTLYIPTTVIDGNETEFLEKLNASVVSAKQKEAEAAPAMLEDIVKEWQAAKAKNENLKNTQSQLDRLEQQMGSHVANEISKEAEELTTNLFETVEENRQTIAAGIFNDKALDELFKQVIPENLSQAEQEQIRFALAQEAATTVLQKLSQSQRPTEAEFAALLGQELQNIAKREIHREVLVANPQVFTGLAKTHINNAVSASIANSSLEQVYTEGESNRHNAVAAAYIGNKTNAGTLGEHIEAGAPELTHIKEFTARVREALEKEVAANPQFGTQPTEISRLVTRVYQDNQASFPTLAGTYTALGERLARVHSQNITRVARLSYLQKVRARYPARDVPPFSGTKSALLESQSLTDAALPWIQLAFPSRLTAGALARTPASLLLGAGLSLGSRLNPTLRDAWSVSLIGYETEQLKTLKTFYENLQRQAAILTGYQRQLALQRSGGALFTIGEFEEFLKNPPAGTFLMRIFWRITYLQKDAKFIENFINASAAPRYIQEMRKKLRTALGEKPEEHKGRPLHELELELQKESDHQAPSRGFLSRLKTRALPKLLRRGFGTDIDFRNGKAKLTSFLRKRVTQGIGNFLKNFVKQRLSRGAGLFGRTGFRFARFFSRGLGGIFQKALLPLLQRFLPFLANAFRTIGAGLVRGAAAAIRGFLGGFSLAARGAAAAATVIIPFLASPAGVIIAVAVFIIGMVFFIMFFVAPATLQTEFPGGGSCPDQSIINTNKDPATCRYLNASINIFDVNISPQGVESYINTYSQTFINAGKGDINEFRRRVRYIINQSTVAGLNPALFLGYWKTESLFSTVGTRDMGCVGDNFSEQVDCSLGIEAFSDPVKNPIPNCVRSKNADSAACRTLKAIRDQEDRVNPITYPIATFDDFTEAYGAKSEDANNCSHTYNILIEVARELNACAASSIVPPGDHTITPPPLPDNVAQAITAEFGITMIGAWDQKHLQWIFESFWSIKQTNPKFIQLINGESIHLITDLPNQLKGYVEMSQTDGPWGNYGTDREYFLGTLAHELGHTIYWKKSDTLSLVTAINNLYANPGIGAFSSYSRAQTNRTENYPEVVAYCVIGRAVGSKISQERWTQYKPLAEQVTGGQCRK